MQRIRFIPKKIMGLKTHPHLLERMNQRNISVEDIETVINKRENVYRKSDDCKVIQAKTPRGWISISSDLKEKHIYTCWVN